MVDEARIVAAHRRVDHDVIVDREQVRVVPLIRRIGIARVGLFGCETLAGVFDQTRAARDSPCRERAETLNARRPDLERLRVFSSTSLSTSNLLVRGHAKDASKCQSRAARVCTTVTPPEIMNAMTRAGSALMRSTRDAGTTRMCPANP